MVNDYLNQYNSNIDYKADKSVKSKKSVDNLINMKSYKLGLNFRKEKTRSKNTSINSLSNIKVSNLLDKIIIIYF